MKIAVLGTGMVGRAVAVGLANLGLDVVVGTRAPAQNLAGTGPEDLGTWSVMHPQIGVATYAEAAREAVLVVNALNGAVSVAGVRAAEIADGTVLLDIANPLDFSGDAPALFVGDITTARGTEALMLLWIRLMGPLGMPYFTWKIAR